jgi:hypothetical protein
VLHTQALPNYPRQQPTDGFRNASHRKRYGQPDQQDDDGNEQRDAGGTGE